MVAIKCMQKTRANQSRDITIGKVQREAAALLRAQRCPTVVRMLGRFEDAEGVQIVMELCKGGDLRRHVERYGTLDEPSLAIVAWQVLSMLQACHRLGILYSDVKPGNFCFVREERRALGDPHASGAGVPLRIKAVDFGCSQLVGKGRLSKRTGTLAYMAPEVFQQNYSYKVGQRGCVGQRRTGMRMQAACPHAPPLHLLFLGHCKE
eukprot:134264-Chlamydomonas_euryale.AAC.3